MKILQFGKYFPPDFGGMKAVIFELTEGFLNLLIPLFLFLLTQAEKIIAINPSYTEGSEHLKNYVHLSTNIMLRLTKGSN